VAFIVSNRAISIWISIRDDSAIQSCGCALGELPEGLPIAGSRAH
jgi:hypothetical protein